MERSARGMVLRFVCILSAFIAGNISSGSCVRITGITGPAAMVTGIVVFAVVFFTVLTIMERCTGIRIFGFGGA